MGVNKSKKTEEKTEKDISLERRKSVTSTTQNIPIKPGRALEVLHRIESSSRQFAIYTKVQTFPKIPNHIS